MTISWLDHVNLLTANLLKMSEFYEEVLGLAIGPRPPFVGFDGAWHYCGDQPVVHLVEVVDSRDTRQPRIEHFAFRGEDIEAFTQKLKRLNVAYTTALVPGNGICQVNIFDPDQNHIEIQFLVGEERLGN